MSAGTGNAAARTWTLLRETRHAPPGYASSAARRSTYQASLEQAEQMFAAAAQVGVATRPLQVFYGLSQGGRAVAAAARVLSGNDYRLVGHGIKANGLDASDITGVRLTREGGDATSFARLSLVLGSPQLDGTSVPLPDLWHAIPEGAAVPLDAAWEYVPLRVNLDEIADNSYVGKVMFRVHGLPDRFFPQIGFLPDTDLTAFLEHFPSLAGYTDADYLSPDKALFLRWNTSHQGLPTLDDALDKVTPYLSGHYVMPAVGTQPAPMHPLMVWWAVVYALSMLARYQPDRWAAAIDVDRSAFAVAIEHLLDQALTVLPALLYTAIVDVS